MAEPTKKFPGLLHPLTLMRRARGLPSLDYQTIEPTELPEPYRQLLAHEGDMTTRLENHHRTSIRVRRLRSSNDGKGYFREVILETDGPTVKAVEYGAIEIQLAQLSQVARDAVVAGKIPLGTILNQERISYSCSLRGFFRTSPDASIREAFGVELPDTLYGRSNQIVTRTNETIANIVEILPPA
jgi:chorismate-pyruvate lyase